MTNNQFRGGVHTNIVYAFEDPGVWGEAAESMTLSDETFISFGQGIDTSVVKSNNKIRNFGVGNRDAQSTSVGAFTSTLTVNGAVTDFYWLLGALGSVADAGTTGAYTHTYTPADRLPSFSAKRPIVFNTAQYEQLQGCLINQATLTAAVNEVLKFNLDCPLRYSGIETGAVTDPTYPFKVYTFVGGTISVGGSEIMAIQNFELTIVNNVEMVPEVGSRFAAGYAVKTREYNIKFTAAITDFALMSQFYNGSTGTEPGTDSGEISTMVLTFVNEDDEQAVFNFANIHFNEDTLPTKADEIVKEDITGWANTLTNVVYTNSVETAPNEADNV